jgi:tetraacyldisaccharide 4'-kinase
LRQISQQFQQSRQVFFIMNNKKPVAPYFLGRPFSPLYALAMKLRAELYRRALLTSHRFEVPVISVGNLTMGGTGKTPLVIAIARLLRSHGYRPAVISRGYKGAAREDMTVVSDGNSLLADSFHAGDEPYLIADRLRDVVVITGRKRQFPCRLAIDRYGCDVLLLDDGFQHLAVARSLDLVLFDVDHFAGNSRVFPGGELREPISALHRCDAFVLSGVSPSNQDRADKCAHLLATRFGHKPVVQVSRQYSQVIRHEMTPIGPQSRIVTLADIPRPLYCFCAIARPERLQKSLAEHGIEVSGFRCFADHHRMSEKEMRLLSESAVSSGAGGFLTTEKDMTKLSGHLQKFPLPFFVPVLEIPDNPHLNRLILDSLSTPTALIKEKPVL